MNSEGAVVCVTVAAHADSTIIFSVVLKLFSKLIFKDR